jgi:hypothetical protein
VHVVLSILLELLSSNVIGYWYLFVQCCAGRLQSGAIIQSGFKAGNAAVLDTLILGSVGVLRIFNSFSHAKSSAIHGVLGGSLDYIAPGSHSGPLAHLRYDGL